MSWPCSFRRKFYQTVMSPTHTASSIFLLVCVLIVVHNSIVSGQGGQRVARHIEAKGELLQMN